MLSYCKKMVLFMWKIQVWIVLLAAILFEIIPQFTKGMEQEGVEVWLFYNDDFNDCQKPTGVYNSYPLSFNCKVRGNRQKFQLMNKDGYITVISNDFIGVYGKYDSTSKTLTLKVSESKCSEMIKLGGQTAPVVNASIPVISNDCGFENIKVTVSGVECCMIRNMASKPKLLGELFPIRFSGAPAVLVNIGSEITFDCGEDKKRSSSCSIKVNGRYQMYPDIPDHCPTSAVEDSSTSTSTSTTSTSTTLTSTSTTLTWTTQPAEISTTTTKQPVTSAIKSTRRKSTKRTHTSTKKVGSAGEKYDDDAWDQEATEGEDIFFGKFDKMVTDGVAKDRYEAVSIALQLKDKKPVTGRPTTQEKNKKEPEKKKSDKEKSGKKKSKTVESGYWNRRRRAIAAAVVCFASVLLHLTRGILEFHGIL